MKRNWIVTILALVGLATALVGATIVVLNILKKKAKEELTMDDKCFTFDDSDSHKDEETEKITEEKKDEEIIDDIEEILPIDEEDSDEE